VLEIIDCEGRTVCLSFAVWGHIVAHHPELARHRAALIAAISSPDVRLDGEGSGEKWFYREGWGPSVWIKVVVHYEGDRGRVTTAFARRSMP
jgi:hypothetical protein